MRPVCVADGAADPKRGRWPGAAAKPECSAEVSAERPESEQQVPERQALRQWARRAEQQQGLPRREALPERQQEEQPALQLLFPPPEPLLSQLSGFSVFPKRPVSPGSQLFQWMLPGPPNCSGRPQLPSSQKRLAPEEVCLFPWWVCFRYRLPNFPHSPACYGRERQRLSIFTDTFYALRLL